MSPMDRFITLLDLDLPSLFRQDRFHSIVQEAERKFRETLKRTNSSKALDLNSALASAQKYLGAKRMAGGNSVSIAQDLFSRYFTRDHFTEGSPERDRLQNDLTSSINQFEHASAIPQAAAQMLYARFYDAIRSHSGARRTMKAFLTSLQESGDSEQESKIRSAIDVAFGDMHPDGKEKLLQAMYFLGSETNDILSYSNTGITQHVGWLRQVENVLNTTGEGMVGRKIGEVVGALQSRNQQISLEPAVESKVPRMATARFAI